MTTFSLLRSSRVALVCIGAIALPTPRLAYAAAQATSTTKPAAPATQTKPAATATPPAAIQDPGWPRSYSAATGAATIYQPQVSTWENQKDMVAWAAVSYTPKGAPKPALGTVKLEAKTRVALDERLVNFSEIAITESSFPTLNRDQIRDVVTLLQGGLPDEDRVMALERVLAAVDTSTIRPKEVPGVKADPPKIFFSTTPAVLVSLDGDAIWNPVDKVDLEFAVNTNWDLFRLTTSKALYLRNEANWFTAPEIAGPWTPAGKLPASFSKLPANENFKEVRANVPGKSISAKDMPAVFVTTEPAELLMTEGAPALQAVAGTSLFWVSNTESDVFRDGPGGAYYYLVAGRWFRASDLNGPWTFATPSMPEDFKKISLEHPRSRVLASVPGTEQANEAVLIAQIPQTARVNKKETKAPEVVYQGDPQFQKIEPTSLERAVNTDKEIIKVGDLYYMCFQAVWFVSKTATGPWEVASTVPKEIYTIPASSPSHSVTYVVIEEDDDNDDWVTFAYVAGYTGMMVAWGCAVWGSGWYYPPYVWHGGMYPIYYPYPRTYGFSAWYNPYTGAYGRGARVYGPYGGAGMGAVYNPRTGTYARGAAAYGPYGSRSVAQAYNPRTGTYASTRQGSNIYGNWGTSTVQRGDDWARTAHKTNYRTGSTTSGIKTSDGGGAVSRSGMAGRTTVGRTEGGDLYAGHDGNVYRRNDDGSWSNANPDRPSQGPAGQRTGENRPATTSGTNRPSTSTTSGQLDRDAKARSTGNQRSTSQSTYRSSPPSRSSAGSYRGGGARGGRGR